MSGPFLRFIFYCLVISFLISCEKDPVAGANPGGTAHYSIVGTPGTCPPPVVSGLYSSGLAMTAANTVTISVNVTVVGTYSIKTTTVNGVFFAGTGGFGTKGLHTVVLTGSGIPVKGGTFPYVPATYNTCNFSVSFSQGIPTSIFVYPGSPGNCVGALVYGSYLDGVSLGATHYVDLPVQVSSAGAYNVSTANVNGMVFSGSGVFAAPGSYVMRLMGSGTPVTTGNFAFRPGANGCTFSVAVAPRIPPGTFTYNGAPGNCITPMIRGIYVAGTTLNGFNQVELGVNVTAPGSYSVSTNNANGVVFSGSGTFATTGPATIILTSTSTPGTTGIFRYTPTGGCTFDINYLSTPPPLVNYLICTINGVVYNFNDFMFGSSNQSSPPFTFHVDGDQTGGIDNFSIDLVDNFNPIVPGNYNNISVFNVDKNCQITYSTASGTWGSSLLNPNTFVVNLTSLTAIKATGTFSGILHDNLGTGTNTKVVTAGTFSITF